MADLPVFTYQTRIHVQPPQNEALEAYAELYGKAERTLFAATETGIDAMDLKQEYLRLFGITARQFNAIRMGSRARSGRSRNFGRNKSPRLKFASAKQRSG